MEQFNTIATKSLRIGYAFGIAETLLQLVINISMMFMMFKHSRIAY